MIINEPYLLLDMPISRDYFTMLFASEGLRPNVKAHIDDIGLLRTLVANGQGISITAMKPPGGMAPDGAPLVCVPLEKGDAALRLAVITVKAAKPQRLLAEFKKFCLAEFREEN